MITNCFTRGPEGWCSYDYHQAVLTGWREHFILGTWRQGEGPNGGNCVTVDHFQWSTDTPEQPISVLALIHYRNWVDLDPIDLRDAQLSVYLRGDDLATDGAACYFWVNTTMNRWHLTAHPLEITDGGWAAEPNRVRLANDQSQWRNSWAGLPPEPKSLESALRAVQSFGFAFVGFLREPMGRLSMAQFEITTSGG